MLISTITKYRILPLLDTREKQHQFFYIVDTNLKLIFETRTYEHNYVKAFSLDKILIFLLFSLTRSELLTS